MTEEKKTTRQATPAEIRTYARIGHDGRTEYRQRRVN